MSKLRVNIGAKQTESSHIPYDMHTYCCVCHKPLSQLVIKIDETRYCHFKCIEKIVSTGVCAICEAPIKEDYFSDIWKNEFCTHHFYQKPDICFSCERIVHPYLNNIGAVHHDGRITCSECNVTAVNDIQQVGISFKAVLSELEKINIVIDWNNILIYLCDSNTLNKIANIQSEDYWNVRGVMIERITLDDQKLFEIQILSGLPRIDFESVLAHELIHVWIESNNLLIPDRDIEGICNLGAFLMLRKDNSPHARLLLKRLNNDVSIKYGNSFRRMRKKLIGYGWLKFIKELLTLYKPEQTTNGSFPSP